MKFWFSLFSIFILLLGWSPINEQKNEVTGKTKLLKLIEEKKLDEARSYLNSQIDKFKKTGQVDSLATYVEFVGSFSLNNQNWNLALKNTEAFVDELLNYQNPFVSKYALKELAWIQDEAGSPDLAYSSIEKALFYAKQDLKDKNPSIANIYYNMGYYAAEMGDVGLAKKNYQKSLIEINKSAETDYVFLQQVNNSLGGIMWREGKMDSCSYYFKNSLNALKKTEANPQNTYYRPALVYMNMAVVSNIKGDNMEAIAFSQDAISRFNQYIKLEENEQRINAAINNKLTAIDNLGVFYNSVGQFKKAEDIIYYSYQQKLKTNSENDPKIIISKIILAQAKINTRDFVGAQKLLEEAIEQIKENPGVQPYWAASALSTHAKVLDRLHKTSEAAIAYKAARIALLQSIDGQYNNEILSEISSMAVFYAKNGYDELALERAKEVYDQTLKSDFKNTPQGFSFLLSTAETYYHLERFDEALKVSDQVIEAIESQEISKAPIDSVLKSFHLPQALLLKAKTNFNLTENKDVAFLNGLISDLNRAFDIIKLRQSLLENYDDVYLLISQNEELVDFVKKLQLLLYEKSGDESFLNKLIELNESGIYNRIRSRLNIKKTIGAGNLPENIAQKELQLKLALSASLKKENETGISEFFKATQEWEKFQVMLQKDYPEYYHLRYSALSQEPVSVSEYKKSGQTTIRYLFIDEQLFALVISEEKNSLVQLNSANLETTILKLQENLFDAEKMGKITFELHQNLWQPLSEYIKTEKIVIIPSGPLFNLNFEMLTSQPVKNFNEFKSHSLLSNYSISYLYSLWMFDNEQILKPKENFIAFAPTFDQNMKEVYLASITDSTELDKTYLTLLPQPFTKDLALKYKNTFKGNAFLNQDAVKSVFLSSANEHKIIHIGTHAESNNLNPELSRLVFAKSLNRDTIEEENSLYAYEIYNYNLQADLAVLTACDTGKPSHQSGEGMISLTHAFTYAGSKSIVTSLWKVDEQSSAIIIANFYDYLKEGLPKDDALRKAKLDYLNTAEGRTLAPQYWAGLILMGDTSPIAIDSTMNWLWIVIPLLMILFAFIIFISKKHKALFY